MGEEGRGQALSVGIYLSNDHLRNSTLSGQSKERREAGARGHVTGAQVRGTGQLAASGQVDSICHSSN